MAGLVTVFGGTGFLGRHVVDALLARGHAVRVAVRRPERLAADQARQVSAVRCDMRDPTAVDAALKEAVAAVNSISLYVERGEETFEAVHVRAAEELARRAAARGLRTLVQISGINAGPDTSSVYARARGRGEEAVRAAFPAAVVLRPSVLFGPGDSFFNLLAGIARKAPVIPLFGKGDTRLQPVHVGDVAEAAVRAIGNPACHGATFELGGPSVYAYRELLELTVQTIGRRRLLIPVPFALWDLAALLASPLPRPPVTRDQVALMRRDNVVGAKAKGFADFGIAPRSVEEVLPNYL